MAKRSRTMALPISLCARWKLAEINVGSLIVDRAISSLFKRLKNWLRFTLLWINCQTFFSRLSAKPPQSTTRLALSKEIPRAIFAFSSSFFFLLNFHLIISLAEHFYWVERSYSHCLLNKISIVAGQALKSAHFGDLPFSMQCVGR